MKSTKVYIYSSQKGHDRQKIRRGNNIWSIGKEQEQKEQLRYEMSIEHITTQKAMQRHIGIQKKKKLADAKSTSSNALGWIVLDLDI